MVSTSHSAECTALRAHTMPIAPSSASGARIQKVTSSPLETWPAAASTVDVVMPCLPCRPPRRWAACSAPGKVTPGCSSTW